MFRNLSALALTLLVAVVLTAMAMLGSAASALAAGVLTSDGPVTLEGAEVGGMGSNIIEYPGVGGWECLETGYRAHKYNATPHEMIPSGTAMLTITPAYINCTGFGDLRVTVAMNGCDYVFQIGETTMEAEEEYGITAGIVCPVGKAMEIYTYSNTASEAVKLCTQTVSSQEGITGLDLANELNGKETTGTLKLTGESKNVSISRHGLCGSGSTSGGVFKFSVTFNGTNADGNLTGVSLSDA